VINDNDKIRIQKMFDDITSLRYFHEIVYIFEKNSREKREQERIQRELNFKYDENDSKLEN
jgi:hypothetical protein